MAMQANRGDPFDALGDPHRRAILGLLREQARTVKELADAMPISRPAVSRHLRLLRNAGLVKDTPRGVHRLYSLDAAGLEVMRAYMEQVWGEAATRFLIVAENVAPETRGA